MTIQKYRPFVLAIGYFDGVHIGHQQVIRTAQSMAQRLNADLAVMTFHPHPKEVLHKQNCLRYLTSLETKLKLFEELGVDQTFLMNFDLNLAQLSAEMFVEKILIPLGVKGVVTGFNFRFGKNQSGDTDDLHQASQGRFETAVVPAVIEEGTHVSSTWIRQLLAEGDVDRVTKLLGRHYRIHGSVEKGDQRGRLIGFPTANLSLSDPLCLPKRGVYIVRGSFQQKEAYGLMNIGIRPTFKQEKPEEKVEVHLFHSDIDLYGQKLSVEVLHYLRPEKKFSSADHLIAQIQQDKNQAETWLKTSGLFT